ncbi:MAG: hypothetical protein NCW75_13920 [Phycisphaera sp.]|nr:MAG: hypothetical protein NCW75_13920 [Phycisphaera sp.]
MSLEGCNTELLVKDAVPDWENVGTLAASKRLNGRPGAPAPMVDDPSPHNRAYLWPDVVPALTAASQHPNVKTGILLDILAIRLQGSSGHSVIHLNTDAPVNVTWELLRKVGVVVIGNG